jgi:hypothetical protein
VLAILAMLARQGACAWLRVAPLLPSPTLRTAATAASGRDGKAGSPIEQESVPAGSEETSWTAVTRSDRKLVDKATVLGSI